MNERGPIQVYPPGLLGLLQLKADGRAVSNLTDTCGPSLEMAPWWLRAKAELYTTPATGTHAAGGFATFVPFTVGPIQVPNGEWWYVHDYSVVFTAPGGSTASNIRLAAASTPASAFYGALSDTTIQLAATANLLISSKDFWLPPGARLGYYIDAITGVQITTALTQLRISRCGS